MFFFFFLLASSVLLLKNVWIVLCFRGLDKMLVSLSQLLLVFLAAYFLEGVSCSDNDKLSKKYTTGCQGTKK